MKKSILSMLAICTIAFVSCKNDKTEAADAAEVTPVAAEAVSYMVTASESSIAWVGSKPTEKHNGTINVTEGAMMVKDVVLEGGKFAIDMNSITVLDLKAGDGKEDLEGHLKGLTKENEDHFFNATKYPTATFEITSVETVEGVTNVSGNLTMKEITKNVSFIATVTVEENMVSVVSEPFKINRTDWGVNYASKSVFDDLKDKFVDDEIELTVTAVAKK
jgi:polyisoprenoid-binding protein YceI